MKGHRTERGVRITGVGVIWTLVSNSVPKRTFDDKESSVSQR